jgi:hypothetical protein
MTVPGKMKIEVVRVDRRPPWPLWAVLIVLIWIGLGIGALLLDSHLTRSVELCLIKRWTGIACPTCGFTRGALSLLHGHIGRAWLYNPLLYSVLACFFAATVVRITLARSVRISMTRRERLAAWILGVVLFSVNWVYVIFCVG